MFNNSVQKQSVKCYNPWRTSVSDQINTIIMSNKTPHTDNKNPLADADTKAVSAESGKSKGGKFLRNFLIVIASSFFGSSVQMFVMIP